MSEPDKFDFVSTRREDVKTLPNHGRDKLLVGSQAGLDTNPAWVCSLRANPQVKIIAAGDKAAYRAREVSLTEKGQLWPESLKVYPGYDEYQARTDRDIPVFLCERL